MGLNIKNNEVISYSAETDVYEIIVPDGVTKICEHAFYMANQLKKINIPNSVTEIEVGAFEHCRNLKEIILPSNMEIIKDFVFYSCESLTSIIIPNGVLKLGNGAFAFCKNLKEITIPDSVTQIDLNPSSYSFIKLPTFDFCNKLEIINLYSYKVFSLLNCELKLVAIFSIIKNYYNGKIKYSDEDMKKFKEYIVENKIDIFYKFLKNYNLLTEFNYILNEMNVYTIEDMDILLNEINNRKEINVEVKAMVLEYKNKNFGFKNSLDELTLDDDEDEKGNLKI